MKKIMKIDCLSPREVVNAFPDEDESKQIAPRELAKWHKRLTSFYNIIILPELERLTGAEKDIKRKILLARYWDWIGEIVKNIVGLEKIVYLANRKTRGPDLDIMGAKEYPLPELCEELGVEIKRSGRNWIGRCPLHDDRHPSFTIFPDGKWRCFGCGESGDNIDLLMKLRGLDFTSSVRYLTGAK